MSKEACEGFSFDPSVPIVPKPYKDKPPEPLTRSNFTDWLTIGFALSRGNLSHQGDYMLWTSAHAGFDPFKAVDTFLEAGGYDALSEPEKDYMRTQFGKVEGHAKRQFTLENDLSSQLKGFSDREKFLDPPTEVGRLKLQGSVTYEKIPDPLKRFEDYVTEDKYNALSESGKMVELEQWRIERNKAIEASLGKMNKADLLKAIHPKSKVK